MKDRKKEIELAELISKRLREELSDSDEQELGEWLDEGSNRHRYQDLVRPQSLKDKKSLYQSIDVDQAYERLVSRREQQKVVKVLPIRRWMQYAAVFLIGLSIASWFYMNNRAVSHSRELARSIAPGSEKARLILASGETIVLEKNQDMVIDMDSLIASKGNILVYKLNKAAKDRVSEMNTLQVPIGGIYSVTLSDGTKVWLNSKSSLTYPVQFGEGEREVTLDGEAYFDVTKDKTRPFVVHSSTGIVEVLGTEFNVSDYPEEPSYVTTLVEGKVRMSPLEAEPSIRTVLNPGEQAVLNKQEHSSAFVREVDPLVYCAWKDGKFYFEDVPLSEILRTMGRWYNFDVSFEKEYLGQIQFTGVAKKDKSLHYLLDIISETSKTKYIINQTQDKYEVEIKEK